MNISPGDKIWVLHDYLQVGGGAERLVSVLARDLPHASLRVSGVYAGYRESVDDTGLDVGLLGGAPGWLPRIPRALLSFARRHKELEVCRCAVYSGLFAPLAVRNQKSGRRVAYCHTPPRFAFDQKAEYLRRFPPGTRWLVSLVIAHYRKHYLAAMRSMDVVATNSEHVQARIRRQLGLDAIVVYPPIENGLFRWIGQDDFYLSLGRLEPNKRVDRVVRAFKAMPDRKLVVASGGTQLAELRALAADAPNIRILGWVKDEELAALIGRAIACIYIPIDEDFGMSSVEAMAAGKPVIGVAEGGLQETIVPGETGLLLPPDPGEDDIASAVATLTPQASLAMRGACERRAQAFSTQTFLVGMRAAMGLDTDAT